MSSNQLLLGLCATLPLAACAGQADSNYHGEVLAELSGTVTNARTTSVATADIALVWGHPIPGKFVESQRVDTVGEFPSSFRLKLYEPPQHLDKFVYGLADGDHGDTEHVEGVILAVADYDAFVAANYDFSLVLGYVEQSLMYLPDDVRPNSLGELSLNGTPRAGFHIVDDKVASLEENAAYERCIADHGGFIEYTIAELLRLQRLCPNSNGLRVAPHDLDTNLELKMVDDPRAPGV